ncbi:MAG: hypothetical protein ACJ72N_25310 [Labedaea sp.]
MTRMTSPYTIRICSAGTRASTRTAWISPSSTTPHSAPNSDPVPPSTLIPPITAAANTWKIMPLPWLAETEPSAQHQAGERGHH